MLRHLPSLRGRAPGVPLMIEISEALDPAAIAAARVLFREYQEDRLF